MFDYIIGFLIQYCKKVTDIVECSIDFSSSFQAQEVMQYLATVATASTRFLT